MTHTLTTPNDDKHKKHKKAIKAFEGAAWFKDEFGILKRGSKAPPRLPAEALFNLDGIASIKMIHNHHQNKRPGKGEIDRMHKTDRDSASQTSSLSLDVNELSEGSRSKAFSSDEEEASMARGGPPPWEGHSMQHQVEGDMIQSRGS